MFYLIHSANWKVRYGKDFMLFVRKNNMGLTVITTIKKVYLIKQ